jgi:hypothetical protein
VSVSATRILTEARYYTLLNLASGSAGLSFKKRETEVLLRRGWVTAEWKPPYYQWVRITPEGLRAVAEGVERYGLPVLKPQRSALVCADCGSEKRACAACGCRQYRYEAKPVERLVAA